MYPTYEPDTHNANCPTCGVGQTVDLDEDGGAEMETSPCQGSDYCHARMCDECVRHCEMCGLPCCEEHRLYVNGVLTCGICLEAEVEAA